MEHCPATTGANDLEITWTRVATISQHQRGYGKSKEEKDHLFLFFCFRYHCFAFFLAESSAFVNLPEELLDLDPQELGRILIIDFFEYSVGQTETVNPPTPLRRHGCGCIIEVFVIGFKKAVVDLVKLIIEDLLGRVRSLGNGIRSKKNSILISLEELSGHTRLAS